MYWWREQLGESGIKTLQANRIHVKSGVFKWSSIGEVSQ
jgi:hypothetical protein